MKVFSQRQTILLFANAILLFACYSCDSNLINIDNVKEMQLEIIPANEVRITWDSTIYQHNSNWNTYLDTTAIDSLANFLKNMDFQIQDMWYPNEDTPCMVPIRAGSEIIIKLNKADGRILDYGFQKHEDGFPIACFGSWRHYKYIYN